MAEIPEDIRAAAEAVYAKTSFRNPALRKAIADAILAERERCAKIAEGPAEAWGEFKGGTPERDRIAAAIRTP